MSLVNPEVLTDLKIRRKDAVNQSYERGYYTLLSALDTAIGVLDQVGYLTKKANVEVRIDTHTAT